MKRYYTAPLWQFRLQGLLHEHEHTYLLLATSNQQNSRATMKWQQVAAKQSTDLSLLSVWSDGINGRTVLLIVSHSGHKNSFLLMSKLDIGTR